jgi:hypothetical protein
MLHAVDVYWVHSGQLSKTPPSGQFLEKGAFIIIGKKNYIRSVPLRIAIGFLTQESLMSVIGGPPQTVKKQTDVFVELVPGKEKSSILAKRVRRLLTEKSYKIRHVSMPEIQLQEIQSFIPYGQGEIVA